MGTKRPDLVLRNKSAKQREAVAASHKKGRTDAYKKIARALVGNTNGKLNKGRKCTDEQKKKMSLAHVGLMADEKHPGWKGGEAGYQAIHQWIRRRKAKPTSCELCGVFSTRLQLSSKDHKYTRNLDEYQYICAKCHKTYDIQNGLVHVSGEDHWLHGKHHTDGTKNKIRKTMKERGIRPTVLPSKEQCMKNLSKANKKIIL